MYIARALLGEDLDCGGVEQKSTSNNQIVKDSQKDEKITIYPNPARDHIVIEGMNEAVNIQIVNMSGQALLTEGSQSSSKQISLERFSPGMYLVYIRNEAGTLLEQKKIVILQ